MAYLVSRRRRGHPECLGDKSTLLVADAPDTEPLGHKKMGRFECTCPLDTKGLDYSLSGSGRSGSLHLLSS